MHDARIVDEQFNGPEGRPGLVGKCADFTLYRYVHSHAHAFHAERRNLARHALCRSRFDIRYRNTGSLVCESQRDGFPAVRRRIEGQTGELPTEGEAFEAMLDLMFDARIGSGLQTWTTHRVFEHDG